ncbi:MAG: integrase family protein [Pasteurellaceae bacterium]|nr:integrase family protein [Pasteurellaceae bacterium]
MGISVFLFRYQYQGKKQSLAMGRFPEVSVGEARIIATRWRGLLCCGINLKSERESKTEFNKDNAVGIGNNQDSHTHSADLTVSQFFWQVYLPYAKQRKRSWDKDVSRFQCYLENQIGHLRYFELKAIHIQKIQSDMLSGKEYAIAYSPATCNRVIALLKTMGNLAYRWDYLTINEAMKVTLLKEVAPRERVFTQEEMQRLLFHAEYYPNKSAGSLIALLLLTGARRNELQQAKWEYLDRERKTLFVLMTKKW